MVDGDDVWGVVDVNGVERGGVGVLRGGGRVFEVVENRGVSGGVRYRRDVLR